MLRNLGYTFIIVGMWYACLYSYTEMGISVGR